VGQGQGAKPGEQLRVDGRADAQAQFAAAGQGVAQVLLRHRHTVFAPCDPGLQQAQVELRGVAGVDAGGVRAVAIAFTASSSRSSRAKAWQCSSRARSSKWGVCSGRRWLPAVVAWANAASWSPRRLSSQPARKW